MGRSSDWQLGPHCRRRDALDAPPHRETCDDEQSSAGPVIGWCSSFSRREPGATVGYLNAYEVHAPVDAHSHGRVRGSAVVQHRVHDQLADDDTDVLAGILRDFKADLVQRAPGASMSDRSSKTYKERS